jgi:hypothetical protein
MRAKRGVRWENARKWGIEEICQGAYDFDKSSAAARSEELESQPHEEQHVQNPEQIVRDPRDTRDDRKSVPCFH